jgi:hypothetical protein
MKIRNKLNIYIASKLQISKSVFKFHILAVFFSLSFLFSFKTKGQITFVLKDTISNEFNLVNVLLIAYKDTFHFDKINKISYRLSKVTIDSVSKIKERDLFILVYSSNHMFYSEAIDKEQLCNKNSIEFCIHRKKKRRIYNIVINSNGILRPYYMYKIKIKPTRSS